MSEPDPYLVGIMAKVNSREAEETKAIMSEKPQPVAWASTIAISILPRADELKSLVSTALAPREDRDHTQALYSEASLSLARNEALEEAAKVMDDEADKLAAKRTRALSEGRMAAVNDYNAMRNACVKGAAAIRARKTE